MRSKILAALSALAIAVGMVTFTTATANAHQGNIAASVVCNTNTGLYDVTYTLSWSNVPDGVHAELSSRTGSTTFQNGWSFATWSDWTSRGNSTGSAGSIHWTEQLPGTTTGNGPWVYAYTNWSNGYDKSKVHDTRIEGLDGKCKIPTPLDASASATPTAGTCNGPGGVTFTLLNAKWENDTDLTDGSRNAIADKGHLFPGGHETIPVGYQIQPQLTGQQCAPTCITAVWSMPNWINSTTPSWPQTLYTSFVAPCGDLTWTPPDGCGLQFQIDSYYDNAITKSLLEGGHLYGSHDPDESLVPGGWGVAYRLVKSASDCTTAPAATTILATCTSPSQLSLTGAHVTFTVVQGNDPTGTTDIAAGNYTVYNTWGDASSGPYYGPVTVTAQLDPGYSLPGVGASLGPWPLVVAAPLNCVTVVPAVTFTNDCGVDNDAIIGGGDTTKIDYTIVDDRDSNGKGLVTATAAAKTGFVFAAGAYTGPWSQAFTNDPCPIKVKPLEPDAFDPTCPDDPDAHTGYLVLDQKTGLHYTIDTVPTTGPTPTTATKIDVTPGTYVIKVTVDSGYELIGPNSWTLLVAEPDCPDTLALLSTTASTSNLTCKTAGSYTLAATAGIAWFVNGSTTATPAGTYQRSTPGVVTAEAKLVDTVNDGWEDNAQKNWTFTFTNAVDCLPTLAFTGSNGGNLGLLLSGGFLLFGGTIIAFERRFRREVG